MINIHLYKENKFFKGILQFLDITVPTTVTSEPRQYHDPGDGPYKYGKLPYF